MTPLAAQTVQWHTVDIAVLAAYFAGMIAIGFLVMRRASRGIDAYFLGGKQLSWWVLGMSNASAMWDVSGTMWLVYNVFVYGAKGLWLPWLWPTFNQVFLAVYLSTWIRRSAVTTGAEWIGTRFGSDRGAALSRIVVVGFALVSVIGFTAYGFEGIGKFTAEFLPWGWSPRTYGIVITVLTAVYVLMGGMLSVVLTDLLQFFLMGVCALAIAGIAMARISPEMLAAAVPEGWMNPFFGARLNLDWSALIPALNANIAKDGYSLFGVFFMAMLCKGVLISIAGPAPNYDMQRILAAKSPREAALMSAVVSAALLPRWGMIAGITALAVVFLGPQFRTMPVADFEMILPWVIKEQIPPFLLGLLLAGLLAAFMSTFSATLNAGGAYLVNDLYRKYLKPEATARHYVAASWIAQIGILVVGVWIGMQGASINDYTQWIVSGLWGGYTAPNVLKWHWWRLNGYGYFWGMVSGIGCALVCALPAVSAHITAFQAFPVILVVSALSSIGASLLTPAENDAVLARFYRQVRPWGIWGPVLEKVRAADPAFQANRNAVRDLCNVALGIVWQVTLVTIPLYMVFRNAAGFWISMAVLAATSVVLKRTWYSKLEH